jgi:hypothetical protein
VSGVRSSPALKWIIIALLPITLVWKLAIRTVPSNEVTEKEVLLKVAGFLTRQHFNVSLSEGPSLHATAPLCRILVVRSPPIGWDRELIRRTSMPGDRVFVAYRGRVYPEQPTWLTAVDALWSRFERELGLRRAAPVILGVVASSTCEAEKLPWGEVATISVDR